MWCLCAWQNRQCSCGQGQHVKSKLYNFRQNWNISTEIIHSLGLLFEATGVFKTTDPRLGPNHCTALFFLSLWILRGQAATGQHAEGEVWVSVRCDLRKCPCADGFGWLQSGLCVTTSCSPVVYLLGFLFLPLLKSFILQPSCCDLKWLLIPRK